MMIDRHGSARARLQLAFSIFDVDGSGLVSEEEFRGVMGQVGLTAEQLKPLLATVDRDGDGRIDF
jgi:Ca2+-binding EF-hand superfamily protein